MWLTGAGMVGPLGWLHLERAFVYTHAAAQQMIVEGFRPAASSLSTRKLVVLLEKGEEDLLIR